MSKRKTRSQRKAHPRQQLPPPSHPPPAMGKEVHAPPSQPLPVSEQMGKNVQTQKVTLFSGPIPPPETLREYEETAPGSANKIFQMAEKEQEHRHTMEKTNMENSHHERKQGQQLGLVVTLAFLAVAVYALTIGAQIAAASIGSIVIVGPILPKISESLIKLVNEYRHNNKK